MTKLLCPIATCAQSSFGVPTTHQLHIEQHLLAAHGIRVTSSTRAFWRSEQDRVWNEKMDKVSSELAEAGSRHRRRMMEAQEDDRAPLEREAASITLETLQELDAELEMVDSDSEESGREVRKQVRATRNVLRDLEVEEGKGGKYSKSVRHHEVVGARAKAWAKRESALKSVEESNEVNGGVQEETDEVLEELLQGLAAAKKREGQRARGLMVDDAASRVGKAPQSENSGDDDETISGGS